MINGKIYYKQANNSSRIINKIYYKQAEHTNSQMNLDKSTLTKVNTEQKNNSKLWKLNMIFFNISIFTMLKITFENTHKDGLVPTLGSIGAAGYDLYAVVDDDIILLPSERVLISTHIKIAGMPHLAYARVAPRSGLAFKHGIDVMAGVIDSDYRGVIGVILLNTSNIPFTIKTGDRIAQLIFERIEHVKFTEGNLTNTERGDGGFGSTGL